MIPWKKVRVWLIAVLFTGVLSVFSKSVWLPPSNQIETPSFIFPTTIPLPSWQLLDSFPLKITDDPNFINSRRYRYQKNRTVLNIDMHYIIQSSGDVKDILRKHIFSKQSSASLIIRQKPGMGFYALFTTQGTAYLTSCINPRGGSTVTFDQFRQNRNTYDLQSHRLLLWLLGLEELRDWRCMWSLLSVPLETAQPEEAYSILEFAWVFWYPWWEKHFPPS
ncbi:MAG: cyanoexosortase A system-associated protein [Cyanobacteriota bacterium]